ncbi:MAG: MMPL family transporter [Polyangiaceae bacterium]|nr:MMPL family transporter [Myxococcales bacterium]MCB9585488.1 MMPL family transporter [Polyangiaceae bacterium]MCB9606496.1 MMPL family transporter [Polyangiaceae bacterium]
MNDQNVLARMHRWLAAIQVKHPGIVLIVALLTLLPAGFFASKLSLKSSFKELLPDHKASVVEMRRVNEKLAGASTLTVVISGSSTESLKRTIDALSPKLRALPADYVVGVDDGTRAVRKFFEDNKALYADLKDIQQIHDDVEERYDWEVQKAAGTALDFGEDEVPDLSAEALKKRFQRKVDEANKKSPGVDGYYIGEDGKLGAILVRTPLGSGSQEAFELQRKIEALVADINPKSWDPATEVHFTGNLITSAQQQKAITDDLISVGGWGVGLILGVVFLFFLRFRTLMAMGITIAIGCVWSFAFAYLSVGYLNMATGFLASIIAGNGINFGIIYMARYVEARRDEKQPVEQAVLTGHLETYRATLAASLAAGIAYGSLAATDFRGFKHFGIIAGLGMALCWVATYFVLPSILVLSERIKPMYSDREAVWRTKLRGVYGVPFAWAVNKFPKSIAIIGSALGVICVVLSVRYFVNDPMEYDLSNVRNERTQPTAAGLLSVRVDKIVGRLGQDGKAIVTDRIDQVQPLVEELNKRYREAPPDKKPFEKIVSIYDLLPDKQQEKLKLLKETKDLLERARKRGFISDKDWKAIEENMPEKLAAIGIAELPELVARPFTEKDGARGRVVYIVPKEGRSVYDAHYLMLWADSYRDVKLPSGDVIHGSGDSVIFADMLIAIGEDAPIAVLLSLIGTVLVILIAFRGRAAGWATLITLLCGVAYQIGTMALLGIKLNFLNFVSLPIGIGVGADYCINVMKRRELMGDRDLQRVLIETGGAVVLCSLTTTLGYLVLLTSINRAVQSFGLAAAIGEITTIAAAVLVLPAALKWRTMRAGKDGSGDSSRQRAADPTNAKPAIADKAAVAE